MTAITIPQLMNLSVDQVKRTVFGWWLRKVERHCLICAEVERNRELEARANVEYYQKRAALARSHQSDL